MSISKTLAIMISALVVSTATLTGAEAAGPAGLARQGLGTYKQLREGRSVMAPFAFIQYCAASPDACNRTRARTLDWTKQTQGLVASVNKRVNRSIRPVNDASDSWTANASAGDCEDFALTKRQALIAAGLPASALRIAVAMTGQGEGHAVLVVKTNAGDFVLDNRSNRLLAWHQTDLTFLKIASAENPRVWRKTL